MALYRNIAGVNGDQMGLLGINPNPIAATFQAPATGGALTISQPITMLPAGTPIGTGTTVADIGQQLADIHLAVATENQNRYNYLLTTSPYDLTRLGYYVTPDGGVHVYTDAAHTTSAGYLDLDIIQDIENKAGTAGTLFMHMNLPLMAKDTAGYAAGGMASQGAVTMYSTPIADVLNIPKAPTGPNVVQDYTPQTAPAPGATPIVSPSGSTTPAPTTTTPVTNTPSTPTNTPQVSAGNSNAIGLLALGLAAFAVAKSKRLLLVGGVGLLYYSLSKPKTV